MKCPLCEKDSAVSKTFLFADYTIYTCPYCLVRFSQPFVDNSVIYDSKFIATKKQYLDTVSMNAKTYNKLRPFFDVRGKKILDIGCGTGSFLHTVQEHNEVLGMEVSASYRTHLEKKGIPHLIGDIEDNLSNVADGYFDLITLWDVLEHLDDPNKYLQLIIRKLSSQGAIIIWTNNYDDCISCFAAAAYKLSLSKLKFLIETSFNRIGGHNYNFVSRSLTELYHNNNLKIVETVVTDTPSEKLTNNIPFKVILELFYAANRLLGKGKIICHVLKKNEACR